MGRPTGGADMPCFQRRVEGGRKGGTFIDERVLELPVHETMMKNPASYRPAECRCGCRRLHLHDRKERKPRGAGGAVATVVIFLCAECSASWRVLLSPPGTNGTTSTGITGDQGPTR